MSSTFQGRRARQPRQSPLRVAVIVVLLVAVFAVEWLATHHHDVAFASAPADYSGLVQLAPDEQGRCEQFQLDNMSGLMTPVGVARCDDVMTARPPDTEVYRRLNAIKRHFNPR